MLAAQAWLDKDTRRDSCLARAYGTYFTSEDVQTSACSCSAPFRRRPCRHGRWHAHSRHAMVGGLQAP
eukprot:5664089-Alexandrium_andersonii.AAC.1